MTQPLLDGAQVHAGPQGPGRERGSEFVQPEVLWLEFRSLGRSLEAIEEVKLGSASSGREDQSAVLVRSPPPRLETVHKFRSDGNLPLPIVLRAEAVLRLVPYGDRAARNVHIGPGNVHHFLFSHARHQEELIP